MQVKKEKKNFCFSNNQWNTKQSIKIFSEKYCSHKKMLRSIIKEIYILIASVK